MEFKFVESTREQLKARVAIYGLSGAGKTIAALRVARALADIEGKHVALIDTEGKASGKYTGLKFENESPLTFAALNMNGNFSPVNFTKAIDAAERAGQFSVIVIDSLTHAWDGTLTLADNASWKTASPAHTTLMSRIMNSPCHIIATIRADEEVQTEKDSKGKWKKVVIGIKPKSKKDIVYEFDLAGEIERVTNILTLEKSRAFSIPVGTEFEKPGADFARALHDWLSDGIPVEQPQGPSVAKAPVGPTYAEVVTLIEAVTDDSAFKAAVAVCSANKEHFQPEEAEAIRAALKAKQGQLKGAA